MRLKLNGEIWRRALGGADDTYLWKPHSTSVAWFQLPAGNRGLNDDMANGANASGGRIEIFSVRPLSLPLAEATARERTHMPVLVSGLKVNHNVCADPCALCRQEKRLVESHIIPEFMYANVYDSLHAYDIISTAPSNRRQRRRKGIYELLLCSDCEAEISRYEDYATKVFNGGTELHISHGPDCKL